MRKIITVLWALLSCTVLVHAASIPIGAEAGCSGSPGNPITSSYGFATIEYLPCASYEFGGHPSFPILVSVLLDSSDGSDPAGADFSADYIVTVSGGTGSALLLPCMGGVVDWYPRGGYAAGYGQFGGVWFDPLKGYSQSNCQSFPSGAGIPFTYGVPQVLSALIHLTAVGGPGGDADARIEIVGFFIDGKVPSQPAEIDVQLAPAAVPEPATAVLVFVAVLVVLKCAKNCGSHLRAV